MSSAILYIRVGVDEKRKGDSKLSQRRSLVKFCQENDIEINQIINEENSAKSFNRPAWNQLMTSLLSSKKYQRPNYLIFTKWDRFSVNIADIYRMFAQLLKMGIFIQAVEQPLNLKHPESKILLSVCLATFQIESTKETPMNKKNKENFKRQELIKKEDDEFLEMIAEIIVRHVLNNPTNDRKKDTN